MSEAMRAVVQQIVKNTAGWEAITSIIPNRVLCVELTSDNTVKIKIGDGLRTWSTLPYVSTGSVDLSNYYNKTQTDAAIATAITNLGSVMTLKGIVSSRENLPASNNSVGDVYLVGTTGSTIDDFEEFVWTAANKWEYIGKIGTDMSVYYTKTETNGLLDDKVDKVTGKGLSTNDYTTTEKTKLAGLSNYDDTIVNNNMVRASTADTNGQNQLFKTVDGTSSNIDPVCSLASESTLATTLKTATIVVSTNVTTEEGWYQLAEWDISDVPSTYYFGYNILFVINGSRSYTAYGNATLKAICYGKKSNVGDATKFANRLHLMSSSRVSGAELPFTESMFKLTFKMDSATKNITYKLWWHKDPTQLTHTERFSISLAMANDGENSSNRNIAYKIHLKGYPDVNYQIGATGYLENDPNVLAVDCAVADIYNTAMSANQLKLNVASTTVNTNVPILCAPSANPTTALVQNVYKISEMTYQASTNTLNVDNVNGNAATATEATHATSADSAAKSETVKYYNATANANRPLLLSYQVKDTTLTDANRYNDVLLSNNFYANPGTGELTAVTFNGNLSGTASEAAHATSADSATSANTLKLNAAPPEAPGEFPVLICPAANPTTTTVSNVYKTAEMKFSSSKNELIVENVRGKAKSLNSAYVYLPSTLSAGWKKVAEWTNASMSGYYNLAITLLVSGGRTGNTTSAISYGDNILKIFCFGNRTDSDVDNMSNMLSNILTIRTTNTTTFIPSSNFKMTYTKEGKDITYKLWIQHTEANASILEAYGFAILSAIDTKNGTNFINDISLLSDGTFSTGATGYMTDRDVAATASVDCGTGTIGNGTTGTAASATTSTQTRQALTSSNNNRPLLLSSSTNISDTTANLNGTVQRTNNIYANASTGALTATSFVGNLTGTADKVTHDDLSSSEFYNAYMTFVDSATGKSLSNSNLYISYTTPTTLSIRNTTLKLLSSSNIALGGTLKTEQNELYTSTTNTTSFHINGLYDKWSLIMIYLTGQWVSGTTLTHGFLVPLERLKTDNSLIDAFGTKAINFLYDVDSTTNYPGIRWFEKQASGTMTYSSVKVVGIY